MLSSYASFSDAYRAGLRSLLSDGEQVPAVLDATSVGSNFGTAARPTRELRPYGFRIEDPSRVLIHSESRQPDLAFALAQWLWVISGADDLATVAYYNPVGRLFSDDGRRLQGALGPKIGTGPLDSVISLLREDPSSRRAILHLDEPGGPRKTRDQSCANSLQFFVRDDQLEAITTMRSQSALMVLPYDAVLFTTLQLWVAALLGIRPGAHVWIANSFHLYEDELVLASEVLAGPITDLCLPPFGDARRSLPRILEFEERLRQAAETQDGRLVEELGSSAQSADNLEGAIEIVLLAHAARRLGDRDLWTSALSRLPNGWDLCLRPPDTLRTRQPR